MAALQAKDYLPFPFLPVVISSTGEWLLPALSLLLICISFISPYGGSSPLFEELHTPLESPSGPDVLRGEHFPSLQNRPKAKTSHSALRNLCSLHTGLAVLLSTSQSSETASKAQNERMKLKYHRTHFLFCFLAFDYQKFTLRSLLKGRNGYELHAGIVVYLFTLQSVEL